MSMSELGLIAQLLLKFGPDVADWWRKTFAKGTIPTDAEWADVVKLVEKSGASYFEKP